MPRLSRQRPKREKVPLGCGTFIIHRQFARYADIALTQTLENTMLGYAITFLVIALIAAVFGFGGISSTAVGIAQILCLVFLFLFLIAAASHALRGRFPPM